MKRFLLIISLAIACKCVAQNDSKLTEVWRPVPVIVTPGKTVADPPSDAIILFDGKDLSKWESANNNTAKWNVADDCVTVVKGEGNIKTKQGFGDCQLHIEWKTPSEAKGDGQERGNSGIYLMGRYELQVLDNYNNLTYVNGQAGSIYKQYRPLVNACRRPGEWQTYDIIFTAPQFNADSSLKTPARITVFQNGILVQNNVTIWGNTVNTGIPKYEMHSNKEALLLQDHGDPVSYRNIWIREL